MLWVVAAFTFAFYNHCFCRAQDGDWVQLLHTQAGHVLSLVPSLSFSSFLHPMAGKNLLLLCSVQILARPGSV